MAHPVMKVVILCGGKGTRLREETEYRPKPMVPIGNRPILWHIMKIYAAHGHKDFILCLGYKGDIIKDYFRNYLWITSDATLRLGRKAGVKFHNSPRRGGLVRHPGRHRRGKFSPPDASTKSNPTSATTLNSSSPTETGWETSTSTPQGLFITSTAGNSPLPPCVPRAVLAKLTSAPKAGSPQFNEKPQTAEGRINGGFFVASRGIFDYLDASSDQVMFEQKPMRTMAADGQLMAFAHDGFWQPMDTFAEFNLLNRLWSEGKAPWKIW